MSIVDVESMTKKLEKLTGRLLNENEQAIIYKWYDTWEFDRDEILYAFDLTTNRMTKPSHYIRYMDAILQSWKDDGLHSLDEIKTIDAQRERGKAKRRNVEHFSMREKKKLVCPHCNRSTKVMVYEDTKLIRFPLYCSWCRKETVVDVNCFVVLINT